MKNVATKLTELTLTSKPKIILSKEYQSEVMCLHAAIGDIEWSGPIFYKVIAGDINNPKELVIRVLHVFPYDIGSTSYTEYEFNEEILDLYDKYPNCEPEAGAKWGHNH